MPSPPMLGDPPRWDEAQPPPRPATPLAEHLILSQYGRVNRRTGDYEFREMPRFDDRLPAEFEISMQLGQLAPDEIGIYFRGLTPPKRIRERDGSAGSGSAICAPLVTWST